MSWGEGHAKVFNPQVYVLDLATGAIACASAPPAGAALLATTADRCAGQAVFTPDSRGVVYTAWTERLGILYCFNRASMLWHQALPATAAAAAWPAPVCLAGSPTQAARGAVFSPDGTRLVWLENAVGGPHNAASALYAAAVVPAADECGQLVLADVTCIVSVSRDADAPAVHVYRFPANPWLAVRSYLGSRV